MIFFSFSQFTMVGRAYCSRGWWHSSLPKDVLTREIHILMCPRWKNKVGILPEKLWNEGFVRTYHKIEQNNQKHAEAKNRTAISINWFDEQPDLTILIKIGLEITF